MPIRKVAGGFKWGGHGHVYPNRAGAERQAAAAYAHGFHGDSASRDMSPIDWRSVITGFAGLGNALPSLLKFFQEEQQEPEHQEQGEREEKGQDQDPDENEYAFSDFAQDPLTSKGEKIMNAMQKEYGSARGKQIFYATKNAGKINGVDAKDDASHSDISQRIRQEYNRGHPLKQAVAIAYHQLGGDGYFNDNFHKDFTQDTPYMDLPPDAAGTMVHDDQGNVLFLRRSGKGDQSGTWALPGGRIEKGEQAPQTAKRETKEETGYDCEGELGDCYVGDEPTKFATFLHKAKDRFTPTLNDEHTEHKWAPLSDAPSPLHPGLKALLEDAKARKAIDATIATPNAGIPIARTTIETKKNEPEPAGKDVEKPKHKLTWGMDERLAFDKQSIRDVDQDGRLHVGMTPISKACINPYIGHEIPEWDKLGLKRDKVYKLLRHPAELQKAAKSFNGVPLLREHVPHTSEDHDPDLVAGAVGNDAEYHHPYLMNTLSVWPKDAINRINNDKQRELSSSYHYRADMTPGVYEGEPYDGVMRDIVGNHVALVREGRAGSDVVVGDSARGATTSQQRGSNMAKPVLKSRSAIAALGAIQALIRPKLAADKKFDATPLLVGVSAKNWKAKWPQVVDAIKTGTSSLLAKDADLSAVLPLLAALEGGEEEGDEVNPANPGMQDEHHATIDANPGSLHDFLKGKLSPEDHAKAMQMMGPHEEGEDEAEPEHQHEEDAHDEEESEEEKKERERKAGEDRARDHRPGKDARRAKDEPPPFKGKPEVGGKMVSQDQMNAAIKAATEGATKKAVEQTMATQRAIREAEGFVRPWVGSLAVACDSADEVYKAALSALKVEGIEAIHPSAFKAVLQAQPVPGKRVGTTATQTLGMDAASVDDYNKRFPGASRIRHV